MRFLLVEDDEDDYIIFSELCEDAFGDDCKLTWVSKYDEAVNAIESSEYDVFVFDNRLDKHLGLELIERVDRHYSCSPPVILLTGVNDRDTDIRAMKAGASDYLVKQDLTAQELERSIRYALQHKKDQDRLSRLAHYDSLTGLANRNCFYTKLEESIHQASRSGKLMALFLLDLDNFKYINDTQGHPAGDSLLLKVSMRIRQAMRETDLVARLGGDEFAVVASNLDDIGDVGQLAKNLIKTFDNSFNINEERVSMTTSLGVAIYPSDSNNVDELLKQCDMALYDAKRRGKNTYSFFDVDLDRAIRRRQKLQTDMSVALIENDFVLHFQPIIDSDSGEVVSAEALIRWQHPEKGLIPPDEFIPVAESSGFIVPLGNWVIERACEQKRQWKEQGLYDFPLAINLAANQFYNDKLLHLLNRAIKRHNLSYDSVILEITENTLMENTEDISERINKLHKSGFSFSLDDFGTGYSSLAYLKRFPVDKIKIDRSMVDGIPENKENSAICEAIISIGKAFGIKIIAEGVETQEQLEYLRDIACHQIQGYLISKPLNSSDFVAWVQQRSGQGWGHMFTHEPIQIQL